MTVFRDINLPARILLSWHNTLVSIMKTNHNRNFKARNDNGHDSFGGINSNLSAKGSPLSVQLGAGYSHGSKREERRWKKGAKQFVHTRTRRREDANLRNEIKDME